MNLTTMIKKQYTIPTMDVIEMEVENMLALSIKIDKDDEHIAPDEWSNKRQPSMGTWSSTNWNTEEAY